MVQPKNRRLVTESALELFIDTQAATPVATLAELPTANASNRGLIRFVTSENEPYYSNGTTWSSIAQGAQGDPGPAGAGVPSGGEPLQIIRKNSVGTTTEWATLTKSLVGLSNVDNTSDMNKPVSTMQKLALDEKLDATNLPYEVDGVNKNLIENSTSLTATALSAAIGESVKVVPRAEGKYPNIYLGGKINGAAIGEGVTGGVLLNPGSIGYENVIGGDGTTTVGTSTPNVARPGLNTDGSMVGGIDNVSGQISDKIISAHSASLPHPDGGSGYGHSGIFGGAGHRIGGLAGHVGMIGGVNNTVNGGYSAALGGANNTIHGERSAAFGIGNVVWAANSAVFGTTNTVGTEGVASGLNAPNSLVVGRGNAVTGLDSLVGGRDNVASGSFATASGNGCTITSKSTGGVVSGSGNTVDGVTSQAAGFQNRAITDYSRAAGSYAETTNVHEDAYGAGAFSSLTGSAQRTGIVMQRQSTDGTTGNLAPVVPVGGSWAFTAHVVATDAATQDTSAWKIEGAIKRNNAGTPALVGTPIITPLGVDAAATAWTVTVSAHASGKLTLACTGEAGKTIRWVATLDAAQVKIPAA